MKINSNTVVLAGGEYANLEKVVKKIAAENNIDQVESVSIYVDQKEGVAKFKIAEGRASAELVSQVLRSLKDEIGNLDKGELVSWLRPILKTFGDGMSIDGFLEAGKFYLPEGSEDREVLEGIDQIYNGDSSTEISEDEIEGEELEGEELEVAEDSEDSAGDIESTEEISETTEEISETTEAPVERAASTQ